MRMSVWTAFSRTFSCHTVAGNIIVRLYWNIHLSYFILFQPFKRIYTPLYCPPVFLFFCLLRPTFANALGRNRLRNDQKYSIN